MKIEPRYSNEPFPKTFDVTKSKKERGNDDEWLRKQIKKWCEMKAPKKYRGFDHEVKSVHKVYQVPHFKVTFSNGKEKLFIIYQQL